MDIKTLIDPIRQDAERDRNFLHLTANEAQMSETARLFLNSKLSERYYPGPADEDDIMDYGVFTMLGFNSIVHLIEAAEGATKEMLGAAVVNLNVLSGVHAMMCSILSMTEPGDTVMHVAKPDGGHFATPGILDRIGRKKITATYDLANLKFDAQKTADDFHKNKAKAFYIDVSYYINPHNLTELREALGDEAIMIYDASHTMGLMLGQEFQSPLKEGANAISANTHKTLPGPQKGMVVFRDLEAGTKANDIINGSLFSSPHTHHMIALAITLLELKEFGQSYARQVIKNSNAVAEAFVKRGYDVRKANTGRYSENHQAHIYVDDKGDRMSLYRNLIKNNISTNFDNPLGGRLYIRFGTQEITRRGMKENDMDTIAEFIDKAFKGADIKDEVINFNKQFPAIHYSFDQQLDLPNA
jgi:glycine hydroxymethyltransferase